MTFLEHIYSLLAGAGLLFLGQMAALWFKRRQMLDRRLLHEQWKVTRKTYGLLVRAERAIRSTGDIQTTLEEVRASIDDARQKSNRLNQYFQENRVFFTPKVCELYDRFWQEVKTGLLNRWRSEEVVPGQMTGDRAQRQERAAERADAALDLQVPRLKEEIENDFRRFFGMRDAGGWSGLWHRMWPPPAGKRLVAAGPLPAAGEGQR